MAAPSHRQCEICQHCKNRIWYTSIPQTTITLGIFFLCTGFQYVWLQLTETPEACYENLKCERLGRQYNVKNWNAVLSNAVYLIVGAFLYAFIRCKACEDEREWRKKQKLRRKDLEKSFNGDSKQYRKKVKAYLKERLCHNKAKAGLAANACISLFFEGLLSGLYHACPTPTNTQFDYIGITMVSISFFIMVWCKRHPFALSSGAYAVFFAFICFVITLDNVGYLTSKAAPERGKFFSTAAWTFTLFGWFLLVPRYFMLLHFGIPNVIPNCRECRRICSLCWAVCTCGCRLPRSWAALGWKVFMGMPMFLLWLAGAGYLSKLSYEEPRENVSRAIMKTSIMFLALYTMKYLVSLFCCVCWRSHWGKKHAATLPGEVPQCRRPTGTEDCTSDADCCPSEVERGQPEQLNAEEEEESSGDEQSDAAQQEVHAEADAEAAGWCKVVPAPVFVLILLTVSFGFAGACFFVNDVYDTKKSMHDSSEMNKRCAFGFFDNHDVWHLFSGLALGSYILTSVMLDEVKELGEVF